MKKNKSISLNKEAVKVKRLSWRQYGQAHKPRFQKLLVDFKKLPSIAKTFSDVTERSFSEWYYPLHCSGEFFFSK